jgi:hypothetical protein
MEFPGNSLRVTVKTGLTSLAASCPADVFSPVATGGNKEFQMKAHSLVIRDIHRRVSEGGVCRISADVGGFPVWYESEDTLLNAVPEVFASAVLLPAMVAGTAIEVEGSLSPVWLSNAKMLMSLFYEWWGYPAVEIRSGVRDPEPPGNGGKTALFFSGGADSFYSLLYGKHPADDLIFVRGFDIPLDAEAHFQAVLGLLQSAADGAGKRLITIQTNLKMHPLGSTIGWERAHGGALASVAHGLTGTTRTVVSSSCAISSGKVWGSHWKSDRFWSNEQMEIFHDGADVLRNEKLRRIAGNPLVRQHLRVCWKEHSGMLNCCRCEKCLRTMLVLESCGELSSFRLFPDSGRLAQSLDRIPFLPYGDDLFPTYQDFLNRGLSRQSAQAVRRLLLRSRIAIAKKTAAGFFRRR